MAPSVATRILLASPAYTARVQDAFFTVYLFFVAISCHLTFI